MLITTLVVKTDTDLSIYHNLRVLRISTNVKITCNTLHLKVLNTIGCKIKYLPYMPVIKSLEVKSNKIRKLPLIPISIKYLFIVDNRLKSIKFLPDCVGSRLYDKNKIKDYSYLDFYGGRNLFLQRQMS
jgi:hypothetical protein